MSEPTPVQPSARFPALQMIDADIVSLRNTQNVVLKEVNWRVAVGDYWAVGGFQSSGKTDLLATAAGLVPPARGSYLVFGTPIQAGFEPDLLAARLRVAVVFEGGRLLHHLSIAENVALPLRYHEKFSLPEAFDRADALLKMTGSRHLAESLPGGLPRNWQQRVGLARALALNPEVLLLDNVLAATDSRETGWWLNILDELAQGHEMLNKHPLTIVATTGDLRPWRGRARNFAMLHNQQFILMERPLETAADEDTLLRELLGMSPL